MLTFAPVKTPNDIFGECLETCCDGKKDSKTLELLFGKTEK